MERHSLINQLVRLAEEAARFNFWKTYLAGYLSEAGLDPRVARSEKEYRGMGIPVKANADSVGKANGVPERR